MKPDTSRPAIFGLALGGTVVSAVWIEILGLAAAAAATNGTSAGIRDLLGGGVLGGLGLVGIWIGTGALATKFENVLLGAYRTESSCRTRCCSTTTRSWPSPTSSPGCTNTARTSPRRRRARRDDCGGSDCCDVAFSVDVVFSANRTANSTSTEKATGS